MRRYVVALPGGQRLVLKAQNRERRPQLRPRRPVQVAGTSTIAGSSSDESGRGSCAMATLTSDIELERSASRRERRNRSIRAASPQGAVALPAAAGAGGGLPDCFLWLPRGGDADALVHRSGLGTAELRAAGAGAQHDRCARRLDPDERLHPGLRHHAADRAGDRPSARLLLGYPVAYALSSISAGQREPADDPGADPVLDQHLVRSYAWMVLLGQEGIINEVLIAAGVVDEPMQLLNTRLAVYLGHDPHPAAVHDPAALRRDARHRPQPAARRREPRRAALPRSSGASFCRSACRASPRAACWSSSWRSGSTSPRRCWAGSATS